MDEREEGRNESREITEEYLMTAGNEGELAVVEGILRAENILHIVRHRQGGGISTIYTGFSNFGMDIYVSSEDLQRAKDAVGIGNAGASE